jgi:hypothetical protein
MAEYSERAIEVARKVHDLRDPDAPSDNGYFYDDAEAAERVLAALAAMEPVLTEVGVERASHAGRGFDAKHDSWHNVHYLVQLSERYAHRGDTGYYERAGLIKAASLLLAAIDRLDASEADR